MSESYRLRDFDWSASSCLSSSAVRGLHAPLVSVSLDLNTSASEGASIKDTFGRYTSYTTPAVPQKNDVVFDLTAAELDALISSVAEVITATSDATVADTAAEQ